MLHCSVADNTGHDDVWAVDCRDVEAGLPIQARCTQLCVGKYWFGWCSRWRVCYLTSYISMRLILISMLYRSYWDTADGGDRSVLPLLAWWWGLGVCCLTEGMECWFVGIDLRGFVVGFLFILPLLTGCSPLQQSFVPRLVVSGSDDHQVKKLEVRSS